MENKINVLGDNTLLTSQQMEQLINDPRFIARLFNQLADLRDANRELEENIERLEEQRAILRQQIAELKPQVTYYSMVLDQKGLLSTDKIASDFRLTANELLIMLIEENVLYKNGHNWYFRKPYDEINYAHMVTYYDKNNPDIKRTKLYWTQTGRLFIYDFLKTRGILPTVELRNDEDEEYYEDYYDED